MPRKKRLTKAQKQLIQAQCDLSNLKDEMRYKENSLQRALSERDGLRGEVRLTEARLEAEQQTAKDILEDLKKLREIMVQYGMERPMPHHEPKFPVSLERHYGRIEGIVRELVAKYKEKTLGKSVHYQPDSFRKPLPF